MIVGSTFTEQVENQIGDLVYRPTSFIEDNKIKKLMLFSAEQGVWREGDLDKSYFCPFVRVGSTDRDSKLETSLTDFHQQRFTEKMKFKFHLEADFFVYYKNAICSLTRDLFDVACRLDNPKRLLANIFSHLAYQSGQLEAIKDFKVEESMILLNEEKYLSIEHVIESAFFALQAQIDPEFQKHQVSQLTHATPIFAGIYILFLEALFQADHFVDVKNNMSTTSADISNLAVARSYVHLHWGARNMAGCPPFIPGYFFSSSTQRKLKTLFGFISEVRPEVKDVSFVILPAVIFYLIPTGKVDKDSDILADFFQTARKAELSSEDVKSWVKNMAPHLSPEFKSRFTLKSFYDRDQFQEPGVSDRFIIPEGFLDLPICLLVEIVSSFYEHFAN